MKHALKDVLSRAEHELTALDDDRCLSSLDERYTKILALAAELRDRFPLARPRDPFVAEAAAFLSREQARVCRGDASPWILQEVTATVREADCKTSEIYAMTVALVPIGSHDADIRDVLRAWFDYYNTESSSN